MKKVKQSFTLVEILVVIVIIGILSSFIFFTVNDSVEKANLAKTKMFEEAIRNNLLMNLVAEYKFEDSANLGLDSWGSYNASNHVATQKQEADCISGACVDFSSTGITDFLSIPYQVLNGLNYFTISYWAKGESTDEYILSGANDDNANEMLTHAPSDNKWHLYTWQRGATGSHIYEDMSIDDYFIHSSPSNPIDLDENGLVLGQEQDSVGGTFVSAEAFDGLLDELKFYNTCISESQIKQEYLAGLNNLYAKGLISQIEYNEKINNLSKK